VSDSTTPTLKQTALFDEHLKLGAKMVSFGGWNMPVFYSSILDEHQAVRNSVGVFDISHMGEFEVSGPLASSWLNGLLTNNIEKLAIGEGQYTFLLNKAGGVIDDLIVYRRADASFFMVVNAAKVEENFRWMQRRIASDVSLVNRSAQYAALAVQGPKSAELMGHFGELPSRNHLFELKFEEMPLLVARTGYTGEDGFEIFYPVTASARVWNAVLDLGKSLAIRPCGLGARDTLRMEVCYPLNGSDLSTDRTPLEAGLGFFVDMEKPDFVGREALLLQKQQGLKQRLVPIKTSGKTPPPRAHYGVFVEGRQIGELTSGTQSPSLNTGIGLAYLDMPYTKPGQTVEFDVRGRKFPATVEKKPLYKKPC
jgi:aminomethyltransferase